MPNWCFTRITINHESETELEKFDNLLDEWTSKNYMGNGFGHNWLGNIVLGSGVGTVDTDKETDLRCRGDLVEHWVENGMLFINTETAWSPMLKMWVKILNKYLPDAEWVYEAEECGCGIQCTNDPDLIDKYIIDYYGDKNINSDFEASEEVVKLTLQELLDTTETDVEKLIEMTYEDDYEISIRKWEWADVDEFE